MMALMPGFFRSIARPLGKSPPRRRSWSRRRRPCCGAIGNADANRELSPNQLADESRGATCGPRCAGRFDRRLEGESLGQHRRTRDRARRRALVSAVRGAADSEGEAIAGGDFAAREMPHPLCADAGSGHAWSAQVDRRTLGEVGIPCRAGIRPRDDRGAGSAGFDRFWLGSMQRMLRPCKPTGPRGRRLSMLRYSTRS